MLAKTRPIGYGDMGPSFQQILAARYYYYWEPESGGFDQKALSSMESDSRHSISNVAGATARPDQENAECPEIRQQQSDGESNSSSFGRPKSPGTPKSSASSTRPSVSHRRVVRKKRGSKETKDQVKQGCMTLPKHMMKAAEHAGLGSIEKGMYGHIRGLATDERWTEYRNLVEAEILDSETVAPVTFDDIVGLADAKRLLNEAAVLPLILPELFLGARRPWRGVLLFGPPGTGKTLLARAAANIDGVCFLNCSAALLVNKYRGDSEKVAATVFEVARERAPAIVFLDEVDAVLSARGGEDAAGKDEASRRLKAELLRQMDGVESALQPDKSVVVMAASNFPWDLDEAFRRRLEKRIYIPLPDRAARLEMLQRNMGTVRSAADIDYGALADRTANYSGADLRTLCREAAMKPVRRLLDEFEPEEIQARRRAGALALPEVGAADLAAALAATRPSVAPAACRRYRAWAEEFQAV